MTKKYIKDALKNNGVKGYSKAIITSANWVVVGKYAGQIDNGGILYLKPIDLTDKTSRHYVIQLQGSSQKVG